MNYDIDVEDVSDDKVYDEIHFNNECDWDNFKFELERFLEHNTLIAFTDFGCWNGRFEGHCFINSVGDFMNLLEDRNTIALENGELCVTSIHHDGVNYYRMKALTRAGEELKSREWYSDYTGDSYDNNIRTRRIKLEELVG